MGWKTIVGGTLGVGAWWFQQPNPFEPATVVQGIGAWLGVFGLRHGIAKIIAAAGGRGR